MFGKKKKQPINVNDLSNRHMVAAISAFHQSHAEQAKGTVAGRHLPEIVQRHLSISNFLDGLLRAYENKENG